jgi:hypothetical protein
VIVRADEKGARFVRASEGAADRFGGVIPPDEQVVGVKFDMSAPPKRTPRQRAEAFTKQLVGHIEGVRQMLGRRVLWGDLSDQWIAALQGEMWRSGEPVTKEQLRRVAESYLTAYDNEIRGRYFKGSVRKYGSE